MQCNDLCLSEFTAQQLKPAAHGNSNNLSLLCFALLCFCFQSSHPGNTLLAQQLLLALSPLHAQLLPRPETAFMVPSAFPAAVGKALQGQLLGAPVLDAFQHQQAQLTSWHVNWHIGLRRYSAARQQEQQQQQAKQPAAAAAAVGAGRWQQAELSTAELDALYLDPDAK
jgi:hypothetical protein